jgi:hypothetical protein
MKNTLLFAFLVCSSWTWCQSIPNSGFENWSDCAYLEEPIPFQTSNAIASQISGSFNVEQSTNAHGGNYSAYLHEDASGQIQGMLTLGIDFNTGETIPLPFTGSPDSIGFWTIYNISDIDYATIMLTLYQDGLNVGYATFTLNGTTTEYTYYSAAVTIDAGAVPNGMTLMITSGNDGSLAGEMYIDDIHLVYNTGTGDDIPGGDFENWNTSSMPCLDSWMTTNLYTVPNISVEPGEPRSGNHSARITNQQISFGTGALGYILLGNPETDFCSDASLTMAQGQAVTTLSGYYKYTAGNATEMATLFMQYSAINDLGGCDSIYEYYQYLPAAADWTQFTVNVPADVIAEWQAGSAPDHFSIGFVSTIVSDTSEPNGDPNSVLLVDDLNVSYTTVGVKENLSSSVSVYPNPAADELHIQWPNYTQANIQLIDAVGKTMITANVFGVNTTLSTSDVPAGVYVLRVNDGQSITTQQIVVQH